MRGSRILALIALPVLLAACGSGDDLKSRWLELPQPPEILTHDGIGTSEIRDLDLLNWTFELDNMQVLDTFDTGVFPERSYANPKTPDGGYLIDFENGSAVLELGEEASRSGVATISLRFGSDDVYYADANGDGYKDAMIVLDQTVAYYADDEAREEGREAAKEQMTSLLLLTYSEESVGDVFYVNIGSLTHISAIDNGFSVTTEEIDGLQDTIEIGWPEGIPVRVDDHGGAITCTRSMDEIEAATEKIPKKLDHLNAFPGRSEILGYDEYALFPLPADSEKTNNLLYSGYERKIFLLDGGDITRWTDYRCGWSER